MFPYLNGKLPGKRRRCTGWKRSMGYGSRPTHPAESIAYSIDGSLHEQIEASTLHIRPELLTLQPDPAKWLNEGKKPEIQNVVATVKTGVWLDLKRIPMYQSNTEHTPQRFAATNMRVGPTTALTFTSGKMVVAGSSSKEESLYYAQLYRLILEDVPHVLIDSDTGDYFIGTLKGAMKFEDFEIQNMVASTELEQYAVHLRQMRDAHGGSTSWMPDIFPGLKFKMDDPAGCVALVFDTAQAVFMGAKNKESLYRAYYRIKEIVQDFNDPNAPSDPRLRYNYRMKMLESEGGTGFAQIERLNRRGVEDTDIDAVTAAPKKRGPKKSKRGRPRKKKRKTSKGKKVWDDEVTSSSEEDGDAVLKEVDADLDFILQTNDELGIKLWDSDDEKVLP